MKMTFEERMRGCPGNFRQAANERIAELKAEVADESARVEEFRAALAETRAQRDAVHDRIAELKVDPEEGSGDE